jgi:cytochrome c oxidase cbb3-type subunit 2
LESGTDPGRSRATLYKEYCLVCHGDKGDGNGFATKFLDPKPRDFTSGKFKIRSTTSLPTDDDINRVIAKGIPGTLMPAFKQDLDEQEINSLVAHVKDFSDAFDGETPEPISFPKPPPKTEELLAMGERLYVDGGCGACHGQSGKGDGPSAATLQDAWGYPIRPYDFTIPGRMKGGSTVSDVYRSFYVGIGGTPMPAYGDIFTEEENWALAYYSLSLSDSDDDGEDWGEDDDDWGEESSETVEGDSNIGRDLVMGVKPFENGGPPCMGCHSVMGEKAIASGGGPWGPDLTIAHQKFKEYGLSEFLKEIPFPIMRPLYHPRPLTEEERGHVLAFLISMQQPDEVQVVTAKVLSHYTLTILIGLLGVVLLTLTGLIAGKKNMELK